MTLLMFLLSEYYFIARFCSACMKLLSTQLNHMYLRVVFLVTNWVWDLNKSGYLYVTILHNAIKSKPWRDHERCNNRGISHNVLQRLQFTTKNMRRVSNINWPGIRSVVGLKLHALMVSDAPAPAAACLRQNLITREFATHSRMMAIPMRDARDSYRRLHNIRSH